MSRWFNVYSARPLARARVLCFAHAGGSAAAYRAWSTLIDPQVELVGVELPGRRARLSERPLTSIEAIVAGLMPELERFFDRPFALFGHSMGAIVAFEVARALRRSGGPLPTELIVSGARAPQLERVADLHPLPREAFIERVIALGGLPREIASEPELMELLLPALRADFTAVETWRHTPGPALEVPITALGGTDDPRVAERQLALWAEQTSQQFELRMFPGGHFYLEQHRAALAAQLSGCGR